MEKLKTSSGRYDTDTPQEPISSNIFTPQVAFTPSVLPSVTTNVQVPITVPAESTSIELSRVDNNIIQGSSGHHSNSTMDDYIVETKLGKGGQGTIHIGHHKDNPEKLAIKHERFKDKDIDRINETRVIADMLKHPNIREIYKTFINDNDLWLIMELLEGDDLKKLTKNMKRALYRCRGNPVECEIPWNNYVKVIKMTLKGILEGLVYIHSLNVIHYDIKLANVVLTDSQETKIIDIGLSRINPTEHILKGTPNYIAPEILNKLLPTTKIDIWSFGVLAYYMLMLEMPFPSTRVRYLYRKIKHSPVPEITYVRFGITPEIQQLIDVIGRALVKDPEERASAEELLNMPFFHSS